MQSRPHAVSQREPSASGPRRLPARQRDRRPGSLHITPSCASTGCRAVTPPATRPSRSGGGQAARQLAGIPHARRPLAPLQNIRRGSPKTPAHPGCSPPPSPGGCAQKSGKLPGPHQSRCFLPRLGGLKKASKSAKKTLKTIDTRKAIIAKKTNEISFKNVKSE